jgi:NIPSNAP
MSEDGKRSRRHTTSRLDAAKLGDFAAYAKALPASARRCGAQSVLYYLPTKFSGPTNRALALYDFPCLAAYEQYREALAWDPEGAELLRQAERSGCILIEDRAILERVSAA